MTEGAPKKVVHIIDCLGLGGAQRQLKEIVTRLPSEGYEVTVISLDNRKRDYEEALRKSGVRVEVIPHEGKFPAAAFTRLCRTLREIRPDIVHCWLFTAGLYGRLASLLTGKPRLVYAMRNPINDLPGHYRLIDRFLGRFTDRVTVNVDAIRPGLIEEIRIPEKKIRTIYNGIDAGAFRPDSRTDCRREFETPPGAKVICMVARFAPQKDYETLIEAAAEVLRRHEQAVFWFIGEGPLRGRFENRIRELGIEKSMRLPGARHDVASVLAAADIFVLSTHFEGCSNVIMEAMMGGKPVVATDAGGNRELVEDGRTGLLVPEGQPAAMAQALETLLEDSGRAQAMGESGRRRIEEEFSIGKTLAQTRLLYDELLTQGE